MAFTYRPKVYALPGLGSLRRLAGAVLALTLLAATVQAVYAQTPTQQQVLDFTFDEDVEGWSAAFADLPGDFDESIYELNAEHRALPSGLEGGGYYIQGHNRSDDLFMFLLYPVDGLVPDTKYRVTAAIELATNVPPGLIGIGGAPGEGVSVKVGAIGVAPSVQEDDLGFLRVNFDKGNQANEGTNAIIVGDVAHPDVVGSEYRIKTLSTSGRILEATSNDEGDLWLIVGTDSGFEGLTSLYYSRITFELDPTGKVPVPDGGDFAPPAWTLPLSTILGLLLVGFGTRFLIRNRSTL